jgi:hypothetical protein
MQTQERAACSSILVTYITGQPSHPFQIDQARKKEFPTLVFIIVLTKTLNRDGFQAIQVFIDDLSIKNI